MISLFKDWKGPVEVNGVRFNSISDVNLSLNDGDSFNIKLLSNNVTLANSTYVAEPVKSVDNNNTQNKTVNDTLFTVTVKNWMTHKSDGSFDWMRKVNNDIPMPMVTMVGTIVKETEKMIYMKLHGDVVQKTYCNCMKCGKPLTHPVSLIFGMGPECSGHAYANPFDTDEELYEAVDKMASQLRNITWEGYILKSAIKELKEVE